MATVSQDVRERLREVARRHGLSKVRLFGSMARGEAGGESDVDLVALFPEGFTLLHHARVERELTAAASRKVELVSENGLRPRVRERIEQEAVPL